MPASVTPDALPHLTTIADVEIMRIGTYQLASGETTFEPEHLAAAVAALEDPAVNKPRIKIGHDDPRFDGEPALGVVENLRLTEDGCALLGDFSGVPTWLAAMMPTAFPARSIEGFMDVITASGGRHALVIENVALLGVVQPGIATLDDLRNRYAPADDEAATGTEVPLAAQQLRLVKPPGIGRAFTATPLPEAHPVPAPASVTAAAPVAASVEVDDVRRAWYDHAEGPLAWWWIRAIYLEPATELIVDNDEGELYRVPFTIASDDSITFSDPAPVRIEYVDSPAPATAGRAVAAASYTTREDSRIMPDPTTTDRLRERLGLDAAATPEQLIEAAAAALEAPPADPDTEPEGEPEGDPEPEATAPANLPEGVAVIDADELARLREQAGQGVAARRQQLDTERDTAIGDAITAGRIPPARRDHYTALWNADAEGTRTLLASLEPGVVPVTTETGETTDPDGVLASTGGEAYDPSWLPPAARKAVAAAKAGQDPTDATPAGTIVRVGD